MPAPVRSLSVATEPDTSRQTRRHSTTTRTAPPAAVPSPHRPGSIALSNLCTFTGNTATSTSSGDGGAITLSGTGTSTITATTFTSNTSENHGGAIYFNPSSGGTLSITGGIFIQNTCHAATSASTEGGGAIYTKTPSLTQLTLVDSKFLANTVDGAAGRGGAIFNAFSGGTLLVDHCLFGSPVALTGNSVTGDGTSLGGAIYTRDDMTVRASAFINNSSSGSGGAIASDATNNAEIGNSTFSGNSASQNGGAIYSFGGASETPLSSTSRSTATPPPTPQGAVESTTAVRRSTSRTRSSPTTLRTASAATAKARPPHRSSIP